MYSKVDLGASPEYTCRSVQAYLMTEEIIRPILSGELLSVERLVTTDRP